MNFIKDISANPLNAYNNSITEFQPTDAVKEIVNCIVSVSGLDFDITPNLNRTFQFNFKTISKTLINTNNFRDTVEVGLSNSIVYQDDTLFKELPIDFTINFSDGTSETETKTYKFLKSVEQIIGRKTDKTKSIFPLVQEKSDLSSGTYFEGYPFDFGVYSDANRTIKVKNKSNNNEVDIELNKGINRIVLSSGYTNVSILNILPITVGFNELEFLDGSNVLFTKIIKKVDATCGVMLKWFNQQGSYSYWLFPFKYKTQTNTKTITSFERDFENLEDSIGNLFITGKTGSRLLRVLSQALSHNEFDVVQQIYTSPHVQILTTERFEPTKWIDVKVNDLRTSDAHFKLRQSLPVEVQLPNLYTQTL